MEREGWAREESVEFAEFYSDLSVVRERDRSELGVRSDDRPPQTFRALVRLMNVSSNLQKLVLGIVTLIAVLADSFRQKAAAGRK